jgi:SMC interacting uncharacterized protein involved in chromosome segregation
MGGIVFENQLFDHWLNKKSQDILDKIDKEQVTTEEMLILTLKAHTNHFHHMDIEFRDEFRKLDHRFTEADKKIDLRFGEVDKKFERLYSTLMWGFGIIITSILGLYLKSFLG